MSRKRFHGLKKVKVRATWNKINLYNLSRLRSYVGQDIATYFQQKWSAKSITRAYHGEHIREKQWQRMFRPRMQAVIPMDHRYLAEHDGSELAAGRGSGKDQPLEAGQIQFGKNKIPFMHMTYAPIERRLDMAVWRALFASSARQARQFCTHGMVKVNGQKMPYAGYLLNPGDMFQVEPDRVLFATGAQKDMNQIKAGRALQKKYRRLNKGLHARLNSRLSVTKVAQATKQDPVVQPSWSIEEVRAQRKLDFKELFIKTQLALESKDKLRVRHKKQLRGLAKEIRIARAQVNVKSEKELDNQLKHFTAEFTNIQKEHVPAALETITAADESTPAKAPVERASDKERKLLQAAMNRARENPIDESKPYATPWRPRPYMSPFAFIPRYLEVNHNICSAVYLRHPVARPGLAEVPTPFPGDVQQLAFNWYLRRR